ncbi:hypothetical protein [Actinomycetospora soli]|uniref:hypothetical protein n=1 Tax=Actinomycetospora soli TaxID=2893887 RepID=UPI001E4767CC|nr:hypothetical protein [Actinomycetospora soli]MCD2186583.1 hypothetical protein [Actinomycetospora soli]
MAVLVGLTSGVMRAAAVVCAAVALLLGAPAFAAAQVAGPWGACGRGTDEQKTVQTFPAPGGQLALLCGGPRFNPAPTWGYRHLLWRHKSDFEGAAGGTHQNWRDVADLAMRTIAADPDATYPARGDQTCRSRVLFLKNLRTNQVVRQVVFTMYTQNGANRINTVFPSNRQCGPL